MPPVTANGKTEPKLIRVIVVDDEPDEHHLCGKYLSHAGITGRYELESYYSYDEAVAALKENRHDIGLIDYNLGTTVNNGLDLIREAIGAGCRTPLILLTGFGNEAVLKSAIHVGAVYYLEKRELNPVILDRSIQYSLYSRDILDQLYEVRENEALMAQLARETQVFQEHYACERTPVTAALYGEAPLSVNAPEFFEQMVGQFCELVNLSLEEQSHAGDASAQINNILRRMAERLGRLIAKPQDVIDIYSMVLNRYRQDGLVRKAKAYNDEARILLVGLLGYLAAYYRAFYVESGLEMQLAAREEVS